MKKEEIRHRVVTFLDRKELDALDNITKDILFSEGIKIPRSTILKEIIDVFLLFDEKTLKTHDQLLAHIVKHSKKEKKND